MAEYLYRVRKDDTILSVCLSFGLTYQEFAHMNPDFNEMGHRYAGELKPGEHLIVGNSNNVIDKLRMQQRRLLK